jgi:hypothetical protein
MRRSVLSVLWLLLPVALPSSVRAQGQVDSAAVQRAAQAWLLLVDSANYQASVDSAAPLFRQMVGTADGWREFVTMARRRYPVSSNRRVVQWEPAFAPDNAPAGRYARISFQSQNGQTSVESLVMVETPSGWRVAMYGLRGG